MTMTAATNPLEIEDKFHFDKLVFLGWLALILRPRHRFTLYYIVAVKVLFTVDCLLKLYHSLVRPATHVLDLEVSRSYGRTAFYEQVLASVRTIIHFRVTELWVGIWMVKDFHTRFTCAYTVKADKEGSVSHHDDWTEERVVFSAILIVTYLFSPLGLFIYFVACQIYFKRFTARESIDWKKPQGLKIKKNVSKTDYELLATRAIRFDDSLPKHLRKAYRLARGLTGAAMGLVVLGFYAMYVVYCLLFQRAKTNSTEKSPRWPVACVRAHTIQCCWHSMLTPEENRGWWWKVKACWLQVCTFMLFAPSGSNPLHLFRAMQSEFTQRLGKPNTPGFFPFGDGVGVSSHKYVKAYLQSRDPVIIKDFQTIGWSVSSSLAKYCDFNNIFLPNRSHPQPDRHLLSRKIVHAWLAAFPHRLLSVNEMLLPENLPTYRHLCHIVPRQANIQASDSVIHLAIGETFFFLATGGSMTKEERTAYLDCVNNPFTFLPDWFNFLVAGNHLENVGYASYGTLQAAFARYAHGPALQAAFAAAEGQMSQTEVLRLIVCVFGLGAAPAPAKITANAVHRLWSDQTKEKLAGQDAQAQMKMIELFEENRRNFIKECARLNSILPMVSLLSNANIARDVKTHTGVDIPANTRIHCSLSDANHDPNEFTSPEEFNPRRSAEEMGKIMTWNGAESDIESKNEGQRPPRYCPGHDLSLQVMEFVASQFAPVPTRYYYPTPDSVLIEGKQVAKLKPDDQDSYIVILAREFPQIKHLDAKTDRLYFSSLDGYTRLFMKLSKLALQGWNSKPPRAIDIAEPSNLPAQDLHLVRVDGARFVATWDEDDRSSWHLPQKLVNKILNSSIWPLEDLELQFNSVGDMIAWRRLYFPSMPAPNNPFWYGDSDELMSQFAFFGLACHHTRQLEPGMESMELHTATLKHPILKTARYINDMTALSLFAVREPFDRYGAAAYFDRDRRLIGIYLSDRHELFIPLGDAQQGIDKDWTYAKYMWRSSALALVTIRDHLLTTHFIEANTLTNISREFLPAHHPLRIFLKPFTYRTGTINYSAATSLVNQGGLCHRIWGFEHQEFLKVCDYVVANYRFRIMPDWISDSMKLEYHDSYGKEDANDRNTKQKCPKCGYDPADSIELLNGHDDKCDTKSEWAKNYPIADDLPAYWKIVRDYVRRFFEIEYGKEKSKEEEKEDKEISKRSFMAEPCERRFITELCKPLGLDGIPSRGHLIDVIAQLVCACTGIHEHVGHVADYLYDPTFIGTKIRRDLPSLLPSVQNYSLMLVLTVLTAMRMPGLMEDWSHLIPRTLTDLEKDAATSVITEEQVRSHLDNYYLFKQQLTERLNKIDQRHRNPDAFPFNSFNPSFMECSVSV